MSTKGQDRKIRAWRRQAGLVSVRIRKTPDWLAHLDDLANVHFGIFLFLIVVLALLAAFVLPPESVGWMYMAGH
jgi:hypothetical protein